MRKIRNFSKISERSNSLREQKRIEFNDELPGTLLEVRIMDYEMEELVPIVGKLAEEYTAYESTSITYEKAEQLMEAVLYCIHELKEISCNSLILNEKMPAQRAYEIGAAYVKKKAKSCWHDLDDCREGRIPRPLGRFKLDARCLWRGI